MKNKILKTNQVINLNYSKKIGLCWGGFDLIHSGHIFHFEYAKKFCDILIVGINSDKHFPHKGKTRPLLNQTDRLKILSKIELVDHVFVYNGPYLKKNSTGYLHGKIVSTPYIPLNILKFAKIDYYFKGFEYRNKNIPEMDLLNKYGIKVKFGPKKNIFSSSSIIKNYNKNDN